MHVAKHVGRTMESTQPGKEQQPSVGISWLPSMAACA
jgi:hypothetical protein